MKKKIHLRLVLAGILILLAGITLAIFWRGDSVGWKIVTEKEFNHGNFPPDFEFAIEKIAGNRHYFGGEKNVPLGEFVVRVGGMKNLAPIRFDLEKIGTNDRDGVENVEIVDAETGEIIFGPIDFGECVGDPNLCFRKSFEMSAKKFARHAEQIWEVRGDVAPAVAEWSDGEILELELSALATRQYEIDDGNGKKCGGARECCMENCRKIGTTIHSTGGDAAVILGGGEISNSKLSVESTSGLDNQNYSGERKSVPIAQFAIKNDGEPARIKSATFEFVGDFARENVSNFRFVRHSADQFTTADPDEKTADIFHDGTDSSKITFDFDLPLEVVKFFNFDLLADIDARDFAATDARCFAAQITSSGYFSAENAAGEPLRVVGFPVRSAAEICLSAN